MTRAPNNIPSRTLAQIAPAMLKPGMPFRKHLVIPVAPARSVQVHAFINDELRVLDVFRPDPYDHLTIVSHETVSKTGTTGATLHPRGVVRKLIEGSLPALKINGYYLDTRFYEPNNVAHLVTQIIPLCILASRAVKGSIDFIFRDLQPHFGDLLGRFGITPICTRRPVQGTAIEVFLSRNLDQYSIHRAPDPLTSLIDGIYDERASAGDAKIYLSRRGSRSLKNEQDVRRLLEAHGYSTIYMEDWAIEKQIAIAQSARDVVALHGAAMGYLALNSGLNSVVELMPNHVGTAFFPIAFGHNVRHYWQLISQFEDDVQFAGWASIEAHKNSPFLVNVDHLQLAIQSTTSSSA